MTILEIEVKQPEASKVLVSTDSLIVELTDGRTISVPLTWFPRLYHGNDAEQSNWRLIGSGEGIQWPDLDEDIEVASLLAGRRKGESQESFKRWLQRRLDR